MHCWVNSLTEHGDEPVAPFKAEHHIAFSCNAASNVVSNGSNACLHQCFQNFILGCRRSSNESHLRAGKGPPPVEVVHSLHKHWVARPTARILAGELQPLPTGGVVGVCQKSTLVLVREAC
jgi:hypothetical protein